MLDPTKCSIATPGIKGGREFGDWGVPAAIPAAILRARGIVSEKTSFYTILVLVTAAIEKGKSATLLSELLEIKRLYDRAAPLHEVLPDLVAAHPERYGQLTLPELCAEMHGFLRGPTGPIGSSALRSTSTASPRSQCCRPPRTRLWWPGESSSLNWTNSPAGSRQPWLSSTRRGSRSMVPGERYASDSAAVAYLRMFEENDNRFPGFENEMQGIFPRHQPDGSIRYGTYVVKEGD